MRGFLVAAQFLTRIPIKIRGDLSEKDIGRSSIFFPLVGVLQGVPAVCAALLGGLIFTPEIGSGLFIFVLLLSNGGFHIDGLADTADGMSVKATGDHAFDRERRLNVMKDSTVGAIGVVAIAMNILLKYLFASGLLEKGLTRDVLFALFLVPVFSKWAMVPVICHGRAARDHGLGKIFIDNVTPLVLLVSTLVLAAVFFLAGFMVPGRNWLEIVKLFFLLAAPLYALGHLWVRMCSQWFGGLTGDNMGAVSEAAEILILSIGLMWS